VLAADVFEINIDARRRHTEQRLGQIARCLVVDDVVDTDVLDKGTFGRTARRPYDRVPLELGDLTTTDPTAPDAAETNTTSPGLSIAILSKPTQAVSPGMPATPRNAWGGSPTYQASAGLWQVR
jgi:hypothetical protein